MSEIVEITRSEILVVELDCESQDKIIIELTKEIQVVEIAEQGPRGPPGFDTFDDDLVLIYKISKL